ncbi:MAG: class II fumarate hydratase [Deltaproteobacteria bacterium]|nr:class II fumarate hydratase [Deltaproteobacteria bacterium]
MAERRKESDSLGEVWVSAERLWGAQTERSLHNFPIGDHAVPRSVILALVSIKRAAAILNAERGALPVEVSKAIIAACEEILAGQHADEFPLSVWQTGSGTHTNMNVNEVIANRASELLGGMRGSHKPVHPNDHVNMAQSSNDAFPSAVYIAGAQQALQDVVPATQALAAAFEKLEQRWRSMAKVGRTHLMDATPMTSGQEAGAWAAQLSAAAEDIAQAATRLTELAIGATAIGTGLNAPAHWGEAMAAALSRDLNLPLSSASNKFAAVSSHDGLLFVMGAYARLAAALTKMANDIRWLSSGPRCGLGELQLPANEPGSSIMPGKVNPSQAEALVMVCMRVAGNHACAYLAASSGALQLNVAKPLLALCLLESGGLLAQAMNSFRQRCVDGLQVNAQATAHFVERTLMTATALSPLIGYDAAARLAKLAQAEDVTLRDVVLREGLLTAEQFDSTMQRAFGIPPLADT